MTTTLKRSYINPLLPAAALVMFMVSLASFAMSYTYWPTVWSAIATASGFFCCVFSAMLVEALYLQWHNDGYPPAIGLIIAGIYGLIAFAGWWVDPGCSDHLGITQYKKKLAYFATWLVSALLTIVTSLLFVDSTMVPYLAIAGIILFWIYCLVTSRYLWSDD